MNSSKEQFNNYLALKWVAAKKYTTAGKLFFVKFFLKKKTIL